MEKKTDQKKVYNKLTISASPEDIHKVKVYAAVNDLTITEVFHQWIESLDEYEVKKK